MCGIAPPRQRCIALPFQSISKYTDTSIHTHTHIHTGTTLLRKSTSVGAQYKSDYGDAMETLFDERDDAKDITNDLARLVYTSYAII